MLTFDDDICYCLDDGCPDKDRCYRHVIRGRVWASYAATLRDPETGLCEYFIPCKGRDVSQERNHE